MDTSLMNWGRGKRVDYVYVYSTGSYGDDGLDLGGGTALENIDEVIKQLKISMREHISELIQYSEIEDNVMANLKANLAEGINHRTKEEILTDFEFAIHQFDWAMQEHQLGFFISDPFSKEVFGSSMTFTTEEQNNNEKNINLYNAITNYGGRNQAIDISFDSFLDIYMNLIESKIFEKLRILYSDPKAINNAKRVLKERNSKQGRRIDRERRIKTVCGFSYYQEYHNFSWETTITINFFDL